MKLYGATLVRVETAPQAGIEPCTPFNSSTRAALIAGSPTILGVIRICFLQGFASIEAGTAELRLADVQC